jgi:hydrogenase nickel incorporation protein HypA/HybF
MHELSLAGGVLQAVQDAARREGFVRVSLLKLEVGALSGVEVRSLRFALQSLQAGTCLEGATIEIDEPPGQAWCLRCSLSVPIQRRGDACPHCGGYQLQPTGGTELKLRELLVHDEAAAAPPASAPPAPNPFS